MKDASGVDVASIKKRAARKCLIACKFGHTGA